MDYPSWLPPSVADAVRTLEQHYALTAARFGDYERIIGQSHAALLADLDFQRVTAERLATHPDMARVWRTLLRRDRLTGRYLHAAIPIDAADLGDPELAQSAAMAALYGDALRAYWPGEGAWYRAPVRQSDIDAFSARVAHLAAELAALATEAERLGYPALGFLPDCAAELAWHAAAVKDGIPGRPIIRRANDAEAEVTEFLAALIGSTIRLFGTALYGCCAIVASVLLERPITAARVQRAMVHALSLTGPESACRR